MSGERWARRTRRDALGSASHRESVIALFHEAGDNAAHASVLLETLLKEWWARREIADEIRGLEHHGHQITHVSELQRSHTLPFERDEGHALASALDDVLDYIDEAAEHVVIYKVGAAPEHTIELAGLIRESSRELAAELCLLADAAELVNGVRRVDALAHEAERTLRAALSSLFAHETDPSLVLRWKDILELLENAVDGCNEAARNLETIRVTNGP